MRETLMTKVEARVRAVAFVVGILFGASAALGAAQHDHQTVAPPTQQAPTSDQTADNRRLKALVDTMNAASPAGTVEAMAAVIAELVAERDEMRKQVNDMARTMNKMGGSMQGMMGRMGDMQKMATECPMMKAKPSDNPSDQR